jgi:predicted RNA-binding Zn-ribbon protein involved in translation (DUF1610 family)
MHIKMAENRLPYRLRRQFLSSTELSLMTVLQEMAGERFIVCPKVALNDIFYIQRPNENVHFYSKIFRKHVDFLLCEPENMKPAFGVELVKPVAKEETRSADKFIEELFLSAGLPLVHVPSNERYELADVVHLFQLAVQKVKETGSLREIDSADSAPLCPRCGKMMVLRIHREGSRGGKRYYGCMDAPKCDGVIAVD